MQTNYKKYALFAGHKELFAADTLEELTTWVDATYPATRELCWDTYANAVERLIHTNGKPVGLYVYNPADNGLISGRPFRTLTNNVVSRPLGSTGMTPGVLKA